MQGRYIPKRRGASPRGDVHPLPEASMHIALKSGTSTSNDVHRPTTPMNIAHGTDAHRTDIGKDRWYYRCASVPDVRARGPMCIPPLVLYKVYALNRSV